MAGSVGSTQADMVLEKQPGVLHSDPQAAGREKHWTWLEFLKPQSPPLVTHFV